jgi:hypothetical protein
LRRRRLRYLSNADPPQVKLRMPINRNKSERPLFPANSDAKLSKVNSTPHANCTIALDAELPSCNVPLDRQFSFALDSFSFLFCSSILAMVILQQRAGAVCKFVNDDILQERRSTPNVTVPVLEIGDRSGGARKSAAWGEARRGEGTKRREQG